jgi:hypothetical protein
MDFMFGDNFEELESGEIERAGEAVRVLFYGVSTLWSMLPRAIAERKRELCYQYLTAWQLAMWYPERVLGVANNGGLPLQSKSVKNIALTFKDMTRQAGSLEELQTNSFGVQALSMIQSAPENFMMAR